MGAFEGVNQKLWRAHQHAEALNASIEDWQNAGFEQVTERDPDSRTFVFGLRFRRPAPLHEWSLLLGDAIHNWRSALDHAVYALAVHDSGVDPPHNETKLQFPIVESQNAFLRQVGSRLTGLSDESVKAVESVQPFNRVDRHPGLLRLAALDNQDKHRGLQVTTVAPRDAEVRFSTDVAGIGTLRLHPLDTTKSDWVVAIELDEPRPDGIEVNLRTRIMVKLQDEPVPQPTVSQLMSHFNSEVWAVKSILESLIDSERDIVPENVNGMWPPLSERWTGQTRPILDDSESTTPWLEGDSTEP